MGTALGNMSAAEGDFNQPEGDSNQAEGDQHPGSPNFPCLPISLADDLSSHRVDEEYKQLRPLCFVYSTIIDVMCAIGAVFILNALVESVCPQELSIFMSYVPVVKGVLGAFSLLYFGVGQGIYRSFLIATYAFTTPDTDFNRIYETCCSSSPPAGIFNGIVSVKTPHGMILILGVLLKGFFAGQFLTNLIDDYRGVDKTTPFYVNYAEDQSFFMKVLHIRKPSPWVGLAFAAGTASVVVQILLNPLLLPLRQIDSLIGSELRIWLRPWLQTLFEWSVDTTDTDCNQWDNPDCSQAAKSGCVWSDQRCQAGAILLTAVALLVFVFTLSLLPIDLPTRIRHMPEEEPTRGRRVMRYFVVFLPIVHWILNCIFYLQYAFTNLATPGALARRGVFNMKIFYTVVNGYQIPYCRAETTAAYDDKPLSRSLINVRSVMQNAKLWFERELVMSNQNYNDGPSDEEAWAFCSRTALSYNLHDVEEEQDHPMMRLDMSVMEYYRTNPDKFFQVKFVTFQPDIGTSAGHAVSIEYFDGTIVNSSDSIRWKVAKLNFVATANLFFPGLLHNWVHFHFPDNATAMTHNVLAHGKLAHLLFQPFVMSNTFTNENGLGGKVMDHDIGAELGFPASMQTPNQTANAYFQQAVMERTLAYYTRSKGSALTHDVVGARVKFGFPPEFPLDDKIPYTVALKKLYDVFRTFAEETIEIVKKYDHEEFLKLNTWMQQTVASTTNFQFQKRPELTDVVATYMWQVSIVHSMDHQNFFRFVKHWRCGSGSRSSHDSVHALDRMFTADDIRIYKNFANVAGVYHVGDPKDSLADIWYENRGLNTAIRKLNDDANLIMDKYLTVEVVDRCMETNDHCVPEPLQTKDIASAILM